MNVERKAEKRCIYNELDKPDESMDNWDLNKLEEVVKTKHEAQNKGLPPTTIVCFYLFVIG